MRRLSILALVLAAGLSVAGCDIQAGNGDFKVDFASGQAQDTWGKAKDKVEDAKDEIDERV